MESRDNDPVLAQTPTNLPKLLPLSLERMDLDSVKRGISLARPFMSETDFSALVKYLDDKEKQG